MTYILSVSTFSSFFEMVDVQEVQKKLQSTFNATHVAVDDTSGGCGASINVVVVSEAFQGVSLLARHRYSQKKKLIENDVFLLTFLVL